MRMRRRGARGSEMRYGTVLQIEPRFATHAALATATYHDGDRSVSTLPKPSQFNQPSLIVHGGPQDGATIPIWKSAITMGCLPDNDIVIDGPRVSRRHAEIVRTEAGFHIWGLGISNGTFVNQRHIGEMTYPLQHGDQIRLAHSNIYHVFSYIEAFSHSVALPRSVEETRGLISRMPKLPEPLGILESTLGGRQQLDEWADVSEALATPPEELVSPSDNLIYEGNVKLRVVWDGGIQLLISFVSILRMTPQVRVVRIGGNSPTDVEIWLALREPLRLEQVLAQMEVVSYLTELSEDKAGLGGPGRVLEVRLCRDVSLELPPFLD